MEGGLSAHYVRIIFGLMMLLAVVCPQRAVEETRADKYGRFEHIRYLCYF